MCWQPSLLRIIISHGGQDHVSLSASVRPAVDFSPGIYMRHLSLLLPSEAASESKYFLLAVRLAGERLSLGCEGVKTLISQEREKKTCCFLSLSYCCFNCDFQYVMIVCEGK